MKREDSNTETAWMSKEVSQVLIKCSTVHRTILFMHSQSLCGTRGGLVVSALDSGSRGPGGPGRVIVLCSWSRHSTLTVSLSTQE